MTDEADDRVSRAVADLLKRGRYFTLVERPKGYRLMQAGSCFSIAAASAIGNRGRYVEGYALLGEAWMRHAWVTSLVLYTTPKYSVPGSRHVNSIAFLLSVASVARKWRCQAMVFDLPSPVLPWLGIKALLAGATKADS
jgi:hypothetical protein